MNRLTDLSLCFAELAEEEVGPEPRRPAPGPVDMCGRVLASAFQVPPKPCSLESHVGAGHRGAPRASCSGWTRDKPATNTVQHRTLSTRGLSCGRTSQPRSRAAGPWVAGRGSAGLLGQVAVTSCPLQTHPDGGGCFGAKWEELQRAAWVLTMEVPPAEPPAAQGTWDRPAEPKSPWGFIGSSGRRTAPSDVPTLVPEPVYVSHDVAKGTLPCERALKAGSVLAPGTCLTHGP